MALAPSSARLASSPPLSPLLLRSSLCPSPSMYHTCSSSSPSFLSWVLRKVGAPFPPIHTLPRIASPVSFFKFGPNPPKLPEVIEVGDPVLHEPAAPVPVKEISSERIQKIIDDMVGVMRAAPGVGLAAPQIGVPLQIIVLEDTKEYISYARKEETAAQQRYPFDLLVICNPKLKKKGDSTARFFEGCLSVHGFRGLVERYLEVEVSGFGRNGLPIKVDAYGWQARILQHECDHLQGLLYVDRVIPRTFRTVNNLRLPMAGGCPKPGVCLKHGGSIDLGVD